MPYELCGVIAFVSSAELLYNNSEHCEHCTKLVRNLLIVVIVRAGLLITNIVRTNVQQLLHPTLSEVMRSLNVISTLEPSYRFDADLFLGKSSRLLRYIMCAALLRFVSVVNDVGRPLRVAFFDTGSPDRD